LRADNTFMQETEQTLGRKIKEIVIGGPRSPRESGVFHKISLVAFFAWIGLGADGLSSSCYGPPLAFEALGPYRHLGIFVALATALTIFVIASSYTQIIELFPSGGGGYVVASKLLSPNVGMVSGCALMVDYVLTITVSVASGADAIFSFLPPGWAEHKLLFAVSVVIVLTLLNLRGVRESIGPLVPIFLTFVITHAIIIVYALIDQAGNLGSIFQAAPLAPQAAAAAAAGPEAVVGMAPLGFLAMFMVILHAYSMGAGTYTGIEAVSNGLPILREPRVKTARRTMQYMWISLAITVTGLMVAYLLYLHNVDLTKGLPKDKTLNALLLEAMTKSWPGGSIFTVVTLLSEAALLFVAAQTGFLGGPRVLASMALDRWFPSRLSMLSDRLVTKNGILLMALAAVITMVATGGSLEMLIVLYSINVFISFILSQLGMVGHWWRDRKGEGRWIKGLLINGSGLLLSFFILGMILRFKFFQGGWVTLVVTGGLILLALLIKRHYTRSRQLLEQFNNLALAAVAMPAASGKAQNPAANHKPDPSAKTAVLLVTGFNGLGIHAIMNIFRFFGDTFRNFVFVRVGLIDAENFKGADEVKHLEQFVRKDAQRYVEFINRQGYYAQATTSVGADVVDEVEKLSSEFVEKFPQAIFFAGQMLFPNDSFVTRILHNNITFALQRRLYHKGIPFVMLPIRVMAAPPRKWFRGS
jgi:amino acid transporter